MQPGFQLVHIRYVSVVTVLLQAGLSVWLVQREMNKRLAGMPQAA
jgi:hypothetical protein